MDVLVLLLAPRIAPSRDSGCSLAPILLFTCPSHLRFTLALHTCSSLAFLHLPRLWLTCTSQHHNTPVCLSVVCVWWPPTHSLFCAGRSPVSRIQPTPTSARWGYCSHLFEHMRCLRVAALVAVCGCFSPIVHLIPCFPQYPLCSSSVSNLLCVCHYGAQLNSLVCSTSAPRGTWATWNTFSDSFFFFMIHLDLWKTTFAAISACEFFQILLLFTLW